MKQPWGTMVLDWPISRTITIPNPGEYVEKLNFTHCKILQPLWKTIQLLLTKMKDTLFLWPSNYTTWYLPKELENSCPHKNLYTTVCIKFIHNWQKTWKRPRFVGWMNNLCYIQTMEYYLVLKRKDTEEPHILLSRRNQSDRLQIVGFQLHGILLKAKPGKQ